MKKEKIRLSEAVIQDLFSKKILRRNYSEPGTFTIDVDKVIVMQELVIELESSKAEPDVLEAWVTEWRALFPKGKNSFTGLLYKGDKQMCLKNMKKFMKDYDFTKEEIMEITANAISRASIVDYEFFPAAHYFIHKQSTGSRLAQLGELYRDGEIEEGPRGRTVI